jgi:Ni,Fe-hydrogenase III small subunit
MASEWSIFQIGSKKTYPSGTYNAALDPKWVVALGTCARDGGIFAASAAWVGCRTLSPSTCTLAAARPRPHDILAGSIAQQCVQLALSKAHQPVVTIRARLFTRQ